MWRHATWAVLFLAAGCSIDSEGTGAAPAEAGAGVGGGTGGIGTTQDGGWVTGGAAGSAASGGAAGAGATATGGAAGAAASGGAAGAAASGGGPGTGEICDDGKDNDKDGLIDCADPECGAFQCVPTAPGGWTGPVIFNQSATAPPTCNAALGYPSESLKGGTLNVLAAACQTCGCDTTGLNCPNPTVKTYDKPNCSTELDSGTFTGCKDFSGGNKDQESAKLTLVEPSGACGVVTTGTPWIPTPDYTTGARACDGSKLGAGCSSGVCTRSPGGGYNKLCIHKDGKQTCPAAYPNSFQVTTSFDDKRSCTTCSCEKPARSVTATLKDAPGCGDPTIGTLTQHNQCVNFPAENNMAAFVQTQLSCAANGGQLQGQVDQTVVTVCCL